PAVDGGCAVVNAADGLVVPKLLPHIPVDPQRHGHPVTQLEPLRPANPAVRPTDPRLACGQAKVRYLARAELQALARTCKPHRNPVALHHLHDTTGGEVAGSLQSHLVSWFRIHRHFYGFPSSRAVHECIAQSRRSSPPPGSSRW